MIRLKNTLVSEVKPVSRTRDVFCISTFSRLFGLPRCVSTRDAFKKANNNEIQHLPLAGNNFDFSIGSGNMSITST